MTFSRFSSLLSSPLVDAPRSSGMRTSAVGVARRFPCYVPLFVRKRRKNSSRSLLLATAIDRKLSPTSMVIGESVDTGVHRGNLLSFGSSVVAKFTHYDVSVWAIFLSRSVNGRSGRDSVFKT